MQSDCIAIAERVQSECRANAEQVQGGSECWSNAERVQSRCRANAEREQSECRVDAESDCRAKPHGAQCEHTYSVTMFWRCPGRAQELTKKLLQAPFHLPLSFIPLSLSFLSFLLPSPFRFPSFLWFLLPIALLSALFQPTLFMCVFHPIFHYPRRGTPAQFFFMDLPNSFASAWISTIFFQKKILFLRFWKKRANFKPPLLHFSFSFPWLSHSTCLAPPVGPQALRTTFSKIPVFF